MAKGWYVGDENSKARKVKKIFIGDENGKARKVKKVYIGDANGKARLCWSSGPSGILVGVGKGIQYSLDKGQTWTIAVTDSSNYYVSVEYLPTSGRFIAITSTTARPYKVSYDGINWYDYTALPSVQTASYSVIKYIKETNMVISTADNGVLRYMIDDGKDIWTTTSPNTSAHLASAVYYQGKYVIGGYGSNSLFYSPNLVNWSWATSSNTQPGIKMATDGNRILFSYNYNSGHGFTDLGSWGTYGTSSYIYFMGYIQGSFVFARESKYYVYSDGWNDGYYNVAGILRDMIELDGKIYCAQTGYLFIRSSLAGNYQTYQQIKLSADMYAITCAP